MGSVYSVSQLNAYIKNMFAQDYLLGRVSVRGEVSNCKYHSSGTVYFTLKDEGAAISCVLFASARSRVRFRIADGMRVVAGGRAGVYEKAGTYQLYVSDLTADGVGALYERFEALREELEAMGMFDPSYKKPLPSYIRTLGVVTAPTGAAVRDIIQISKRRNPGIRILLYPAQVQGEGAAASIAEGIRVLDGAGVDVIIAGRGGGSVEDLWAFNEEEVARAFFSCSVPIISAVGHETDTVISDFVADLRAPTPSAAAELAVADMPALMRDLDGRRQRMRQLMARQTEASRARLTGKALLLSLHSPANALAQVRLTLDERGGRLSDCMQRYLMRSRARAELAGERLKALSPAAALTEGTAYVRDADGRKISRAADLKKGDALTLTFADGSVLTEVRETMLFEDGREDRNGDGE